MRPRLEPKSSLTAPKVWTYAPEAGLRPARNESIDSSDGALLPSRIGHVSEKPNSSEARLNPVTIDAWRAAVSDDSGKAFAELVHEDVVLEGSVFDRPVAGREAVRNAIRQSSTRYDRLEFTHETQSTDRTYFEWEGTALGLPVWGGTAITVGVDGRVDRVVLSHRPLDLVIKFSAALVDRIAQS
jgi:hypothetical protein